MSTPREPDGAPPERPVIDFERNRREWSQEINGRITRMVAWSLRTDRPVAEPHLRKLGPDGRAAFGRALNRALDAELRAPARAAAPAASPTEAEPADPSGPPLLPEVDWADQRCPRASLSARAWHYGRITAALVFAVAAALLNYLKL